MTKQRATADSWKTKSLPAAVKELPIDGTFTREEYVRLSQGFIPQSLDDKWFIYLEDDWLYFHRSWTGTCIFQLQIVPANDHYRAVKALANRDPEQYRNEDDAYDVALMSYLIDHLLLGRFVPFPQLKHISEEDQAWHKEHVMGEKNDNTLNLRVNNGRQK
ncbi:MAG TPA: hypothetical protein VF177_16170 [Anaerolineae bacterium]